jgi:WD40 repeat protein
MRNILATCIILLAAKLAALGQDPAITEIYGADKNLIMTQAASSADKKFLLVNSKTFISLIEIASSNTVASIDGEGSVLTAIALSPDASIAVTGDSEGKIRTYNIWKQKPGPKFKEHKGSIIALAFSPDGKLVASASADRSVQIWRAADGKKVAAVEGFRSPLAMIAISPDGATLATVEQVSTGEVKLWNMETGSAISTLQFTKAKISAIAFSPDSKRLAIGTTAYEIEIKNIGGTPFYLRTKPHKMPILALSYSPDGSAIASSDIQGGNIIWSAETGKLIRAIKSPLGNSLALLFNPDGKSVILAGFNGGVARWNFNIGVSEWLNIYLNERKNEIGLWAMKGQNETEPDFAKRVNEATRKVKEDKIREDGLARLKTTYLNVINWASYTPGAYATEKELLILTTPFSHNLKLTIPAKKVEAFKLSFSTYAVTPELEVNNNSIEVKSIELKKGEVVYRAEKE